MSLFGGLLKGGIKLLGGLFKKKKKKNRADAESLVYGDGSKVVFDGGGNPLPQPQKKKDWIPWVLGGGLVLTVVMLFLKK